MKAQETKNQFIMLRAEGKSFDAIAKELSISKSTCSQWEKELAEAIGRIKADQLNSLYDMFHMTKEARIKKLGGTLADIEAALAQSDLAQMQPKELLDYKLKYLSALKAEYIPPRVAAAAATAEQQPAAILGSLAELLDQIRAGDISPEQAGREAGVLSAMLKAYETTELKAKVDFLQAAIGG